MKRSSSASGFSLIELMVAIAVAAIVMVALVSITTDTLATTRVQDGSARMQENGRYAMARLRRDIHQMMFMPITTADSTLPVADAGAVATNGSVYVNSIPRSYKSYLAVGTPVPGFRPAALDSLRTNGTSPYQVPPNFFISLHECTLGSCTPDVNVIQAAWPQVPDAGTTAGARMPGTDVITARSLNSSGVRMRRQGAPDCAAGSTGTVPGFPMMGCPNGAIALEGVPDPTLAPLKLANGDPVLIIGAEDAAIFAVTLVPGGIAALGGGMNIENAGAGKLILTPPTIARFENETRLYSLKENLQAVSYYVRLKEDPNRGGRLIGVLVRQTASETEELIEGVDRFELRYGVFGNAGLRYMNADQIYSLNGASVGCPIAPANMSPGYNDAAMGCLLRNTSTVEVSLLLNTVDDVPVTASEVYRYSAASTLPAAAPALDPSTTAPNTLPPGSMLRREFRETISIKNSHW